MDRPPTISVRLSSAVVQRAQDAVDPLLGINTAIAALVRDIAAGTVLPPKPPANYGEKDGRLTVRLSEELWRDPKEPVSHLFATTGARGDLVRDLVYAIAENRLSSQIVCKEVNGDHNP